MTDGFRYRLPPKPALAALLADPATAPHVAGRVEAWLRARGYAVPNGLTVLADGSVALDADRDPSPEWAAFDPAPPTAAEAAEKGERDLVAATLARLSTGTATAAQTQRAVAWLVRRSLG